MEKEEKFQCAVCGIPSLECCSNCSQVFYCTRDHQIQDWKQHKKYCKLLQKQNQDQHLSKIQNSGDSKKIIEENQIQFNNNSQSEIQQEKINIKYSDQNSFQYQNLYQKDSSLNPPLQQITEINSNKKIDKLKQDFRNVQNVHKKEHQQQQKYQNQSQLNSTEANEKNQLLELRKERRELRGIVIKQYGIFNFTGCILPAKKLVQVSKAIYTQKTKLDELYEYFADWLLLTKCLIKIEKLKSARQNLIQIFEEMTQLLDDNRLLIRTQILHLIKIDNNQLSEQQIINKQNFINDIHKRCNLISLVGNLFYSVGDYKNCENAYVKYIKIVENAMGSEAIETGNCYFLIGIFYMQNKQFLKALACTKKAINIRIAKLGEKHECVSDCQYNIGVIYKQMGKKMKAIEFLDKALVFRRELIGDISLPVAQCLETLGKVYMEEENFKNALIKFQECYIIRKKILQNNQHPDLLRISLLIVHLFNTLQEQLKNQEHHKNTQQMMQNLIDHILKTVFDQNLNDINNERMQEKVKILVDSPFQASSNTNNQALRQSNLGLNYIQESGRKLSTCSIAESNQDQVRINEKTKEQELQIRQMREDIEKLKKMQISSGKENDEYRMQGRNDDDDDVKINVDANLMGILTTNDLIALAELKQEIDKQSNLGASPQSIKMSIIRSNFVSNLSQNYTLFQQLKKQNQSIFDESIPEINQWMQFYNQNQRVPQLTNTKSALELADKKEQLAQSPSKQPLPFDQNEVSIIPHSQSTQNLMHIQNQNSSDPLGDQIMLSNEPNFNFNAFNQGNFRQNQDFQQNSDGNFRNQNSFGNPNISSQLYSLDASPIKLHKVESQTYDMN